MEEWKPIPGYEGLYEVSNCGRIKSVEKDIMNPLCGKTHKVEMIKNQRFRRRADRLDAVVCLSKNSKKKQFRVARIVAFAWCDGYQKGLTVNHIDGNTLNNNACNLEWISNEDNIRHGHSIGLYRNAERPCTLIDANGNKKVFTKRCDASCFLGRKRNYISTRAYLKSNIAYSVNGEKYGFV